MRHDYHLVKLFFLYISEDSEHTAKIKQSKNDRKWNATKCHRKPKYRKRALVEQARWTQNSRITQMKASK